jgi:hypothetical protein
MKKRSIQLFSSVSFLLLFLAGCQKVYWTNWEFVEIEKRSIPTDVSVHSTPTGVSVLVDGTETYKTPCQFQVSYTETAAIFKREQIEEKGFDKRTIDSETKRTNVTQNPTPHTLHFSRQHYQDEVGSLIVPGTDEFNVKLKPISYDWEYKHLDEKLKRTQKVRIVSVPEEGATVFLGDKKIGQTPCLHEFEYAETDMVFEKKVIQEHGQLSGPDITTETQRQVGGISARIYPLLLKREGYLDEVALLHIPGDSKPIKEPREFAVRITPVSGIGDINCALKVIARKEYFGDIKKMIDAHAVPHLNGSLDVNRYPPQEPDWIEKPLDVYSQTFFFIIKGFDDFERLLAELKHYSSNDTLITVNIGSDFNTNTALAGIQHTIRGKVRPLSALYLVAKNKKPEYSERISTNPNGSYTLTVTLKPEENHLYLLSIYIPPGNRYPSPLPFFTKVNVYTEKHSEISLQEFENETGIRISKDLINELAPKEVIARIQRFEAILDELLLRIHQEVGDKSDSKWVQNIDRNMTVLRRSVAEGTVSDQILPFPNTRKWLINELSLQSP